MKSKIKKTISKIFNSFFGAPYVWTAYKHIAEINVELYNSKIGAAKYSFHRKLVEKYTSLIEKGVRRGPFRGIQYPFYSSVHSAFFPKLLGFYEFEIQQSLMELVKNNFSVIVDVGCAEGYYAVGLARLFPNSKLIAFDLKAEAREKTKLLAEANGIAISPDFQIHESCLPKDLLDLDPSRKHLIFSDCEGFEEYLFTTEVVNHLIKSDFIIETHDFIKPGICDELFSRFSQTHRVKIIQSVDDIHRYRHIDDPELLKLLITEQIELLEEKRPAQMEWLVCHSIQP